MRHSGRTPGLPSGCQLRSVAVVNDLERAAAIIRRGRVVVLVGRGMITSCGLEPPEVRGGLWDQHGVEHCATPQALNNSPAMAWTAFGQWLTETRRVAADPPSCLLDLARLHRAGLVRGVISTTTDGLVRSLGIQSVAEIHGAIDRLRCVECHGRAPAPEVLTDQTPICDRCGGKMRPDMVLFGETLPRAPRQRAASWVYGGGSLLVLGADLTRPPIHRIPEEMMQEGGKCIAIGEVELGAVLRVRGIHLGADLEITLGALVREVL
jgi:NAD-dependent deacetylase